jgi:hypothetical protein
MGSAEIEEWFEDAVGGWMALYFVMYCEDKTYSKSVTRRRLNNIIPFVTCEMLYVRRLWIYIIAWDMISALSLRERKGHKNDKETYRF